MTTPETQSTPEASIRRLSRPVLLGAAGVALFAAGWGSAALTGMTRPAIAMAPTRAVAVNALTSDSGIVSVRGKVAQAYDRNFIVADATGKVLVEAGRRPRLTPLVAAGDAVMVQGRFADGVLRAQYVVRADGKVEAVGGPRGPGREGPRSPGPGGSGPDGSHGGPRDMAPPPPPPAPLADNATDA